MADDVIIEIEELELVIDTWNSAPGVLTYELEATLLADTPVDGVIGYAYDTDKHYLRQNGAWLEAATGGDLGAYYTSAQVDTLLGDYYTSAQVDTALGDYLLADGTRSLTGAWAANARIYNSADALLLGANNGSITGRGIGDVVVGGAFEVRGTSYLQAVEVLGNIVMSSPGGTVDGRDIAADGALLDAINGNYATESYADTAASSAVGTHAALTATHGVAGAIVGTTDSQTLGNKTFNTVTLFDTGSSGAPAIAPSAAPTTGFYFTGSQINMSVAGNAKFLVGATTVSVNSATNFQVGTGTSTFGGMIMVNAKATISTGGGAAAPALSWGDGDTGFYEGSDDTLTFVTAATERWAINASFASSNANGPALASVATSSTVPTVRPDKSDTNTGLGANGADELYLIAGGTTRLTASSSGAAVTGDFSSTGTITVASTSSIGSWGLLLGVNAQFAFGSVTGDYAGFVGSVGRDDLQLGIGPEYGRQLLFVDGVARGTDYGHAVQTHPTTYWHSATAAGTATDEWGSAVHDTTRFLLASGNGNISLDPFSEVVDVDGQVEAHRFTATGTYRTFKGEDASGNVAVPATVFIGGHAAYDATSQTSSVTWLTSGMGTSGLNIVNYANISPGFSFIFYLRRADNQGTQESWTMTEGADFEAEVDNATTAQNIADAINAVSGPINGPFAQVIGNNVRLIPNDNVINTMTWVSSSQSSAWTQQIGGRTLNIGAGFGGTTAGSTTINIGISGDTLNFGAVFQSHRIASNADQNWGSGGAADFRMRQQAADTWQISHTSTVKTNWSPAGMAHRPTAVTLGAAATTFAANSNSMTITGDGGGNTVTTITLATPAVANTYTNGLEVTLVFADSNVTISSTAYASRTADQIYLGGGAFTSEAGKTLTLVRDATGWVEKTRSH